LPVVLQPNQLNPKNGDAGASGEFFRSRCKKNNSLCGGIFWPTGEKSRYISIFQDGTRRANGLVVVGRLCFGWGTVRAAEFYGE